MRKAIVLTFALLFVLGAAVANAGSNVASTSQKGSLLVFPKIDISYDTETFVNISNDYYTDVLVKCYWVRGYDQHVQDFMFTVTANQPAYFAASSGENSFKDPRPITVPPFEGPTGFLACWAVDAAGAEQISFNHLYGTATVIDYKHGAAYEYNSWNFAARTGAGAPGTIVGPSGTLKLDGERYDACPEYLLFNFPAVGAYLPKGGKFENVDLTLMPCKQDLRQDNAATSTKAKFDIWNENEVKYTGVYQCMNCWFERVVDKLQNNSQKFYLDELHSAMGRFRVKGVASTVCTVGTGENQVFTPTVNSPLLGLSAQLLSIGKSVDGVVEDGYVRYDAIASTTPNGAGTAAGFIRWDPQSSVIPERR